EESRLQVRLHAVRAEQPLDHGHEGVLAAREAVASRRPIQVAEEADELRERDRGDSSALERDRRRGSAPRPLDLRERVQRVDVAWEAGERGAVLALGRREEAASPIELPELDVRPGERLALAD